MMTSKYIRERVEYRPTVNTLKKAVSDLKGDLKKHYDPILIVLLQAFDTISNENIILLKDFYKSFKMFKSKVISKPPLLWIID